MSSKGRSGYPTREFDSYLTPSSVAQAALAQLRRLYPLFDPVTCLEPGCGNGAHLDAALATYPGIVQSIGVDLDPDIELAPAHEWVQEDYLVWTPQQTFDLIVTNPPFTLAEAMIERSAAQLSPGGLGLYFERIGFFASLRRRWGIWRRIGLREVWIATRRPALIGAPYTDSTEYAYFLFDRGAPGRVTVDWLDWERE